MIDLVIEPCRDDAQVATYIDEHWRQSHILSRDPRMFSFQYRTPWVDTNLFPLGTSIMCAYHPDGTLVGFLGAICAPYPLPNSYWLALWHVLPETKGTGVGGRLLQAMQGVTLAQDGWIGTFGAGPEATPVYEKRGYEIGAVRRWLYEPGTGGPETAPLEVHEGELRPDDDWESYRFDRHPVFTYERSSSTTYRSEVNEWGRVTHAVRLGTTWSDSIDEIFERERLKAQTSESTFLLDCWAIGPPGPGWHLAPNDAPSVFHPPAARGNITYAVGLPWVPSVVDKGDCDQDRPN